MAEFYKIIKKLVNTNTKAVPPVLDLYNFNKGSALFQNLVEDFIDIKLSLKTKDVITKAVEHSIQVSKMRLGLPLLKFS